MEPKISAPALILVRPQMGENIGAVARAMHNFGLTDLRIVNPRDGWPNAAAIAMAAHGAEIVENARIFADFAESIADIHYIYAATARLRDMEKPVLTPKETAADIRQRAAVTMKSAIVLGPERAGLANDEIARAHAIIQIPTAPENPSLNLAQAAVVLAYEWFAADDAPLPESTLSPLAPQNEWNGLFSQLEQSLDAVNYFRIPEKKPQMWRNLQSMLLKSPFSAQELRTFRGMLRSLTRLKNFDSCD